ncbi:GNAT family N-acetyltransferase [Flavitalea sp. BT771]|uniref:GNAT family N-acetyltransferase n=1 Tax=Flavitalea sp. BT771 TaxID=3063329 RepID=UPI0026E37CD8|nr:GNAT family N-acetyltransferase [Flavitalea sp. BT771]MDO6431719.1 GNAT family N-acetyltransferase [Flavitalea sp. BT771]MDV6220627.1 GNAT family N-acetyltransferase [Flavitalea sp. BT771]
MNHEHLLQLDNPAWSALTSDQRAFATGTAAVKRFRRGILPFAAYDHASPEKILALDEWLLPDEVFFLIGGLPPLPPHWEVIKELPCLQMVLPELLDIATDTSILPLTAADKDDMFNLINKVQPGYYQPDTHLLGNYFGIRQEGALVAIAGERMRPEGLMEISAICTDPAYTGRGYARQLTAHVCRSNLKKGRTPYLHVLQSNQRAIGIYAYLGFKARRMISFWKLKKRIA